jgi:hypothetical protein
VQIDQGDRSRKPFRFSTPAASSNLLRLRRRPMPAGVP